MKVIQYVLSHVDNIFFEEIQENVPDILRCYNYYSREIKKKHLRCGFEEEMHM